MAVNLSRNTKVYYTTNTADTGYTDSNTFEVQVMNGYSFSQGTEQQTIQINEAGATPNRGQRSFNTQLNPVDWSFSTYIRPRKITTTTTAPGVGTLSGTVGIAAYTSSTAHTFTSGDIVTISGMTPAAFNGTRPITVTSATRFTYEGNPASVTGAATGTVAAVRGPRVVCVEKFLWNALVGAYDIYNYANTAPAWVESATTATLVATQSDVHTLAPFALVFKVDNTYYKVNNCAVNEAQVSFGLDAIAMVNWSGFGTTYAEITDLTGITQLAAISSANTTANFITNKLSTVNLYAGINATTGTQYTLPITGGEFTVANNLTYLTPEILGVVNSSIGYFTGTRAVSGNLTAYLRTGAGNNTGKLLTDILATSASNPETQFYMNIGVGGHTNSTRIELLMPAVMLQIPTLDIQDVVSTTINFTAQKYTGTAYDLDATPNEFSVLYASA